METRVVDGKFWHKIFSRPAFPNKNQWQGDREVSTIMSFHLWLALVLLFPVPNFSQNSAQPSVVQIDADHRNCYAVSNSSGSFTACLPDVIIAGHPKCGTSALFALIASHPQVVSTDNKEHCMSDPNDAESFLHPLLNASAIADKRYLSGCINKLFNENMFRVLQPRNRIRIVYIHSTRLRRHDVGGFQLLVHGRFRH